MAHLWFLNGERQWFPKALAGDAVALPDGALVPCHDAGTPRVVLRRLTGVLATWALLTDDAHVRPETPRERRFACDDDETRLLRAANSHLRGILVAMLDTCCRPGEILSLQWGDVDMSSREVVVLAEKAKTRRARRLPMSTRLHAVLQMRRTGADGVDFGPEAYVFGDATGQRVTSIRTAWEAARERAGLTDLHLADLRHEAASRLEDAGVPTTYVSKFLGHRNLTTPTRYLNATIRGRRLAA